MPSIETAETIKGQLYALDTVEIRSALRWLNNTVSRTTEPSVIASARHEVVYQHILMQIAKEIYTYEHVEAAMLATTPHKSGESPVAPNGKPDEQKDEEAQMEKGQEFVKPSPEKPQTPSRAEILRKMLEEAEAAEKQGASKQEIEDLITRRIKEQVPPMIREAYATERGYTDGRTNRLAERLDGVQSYTNGIERAVNAQAEQIMELKNRKADDKPYELIIKRPELPPIPLGLVHKDTPKLISFLASGVNVFLTGPAGSGKSTGAELAAKALEIPFYSISVCQQSTKTDFLGYMDATGSYRKTQFREAYECGGLYNIDELDAGNPNVLAVLNQALSGSQCPFPDKMVPKHAKFRLVASGNTWGNGRTLQYVGRNAIDAATLNRFAVIHWDYDESLETTLCDLPKWSKYVQKVREEVKNRGVNFLVTPRASIFGSQMLKSGIPIDQVAETILFTNMDADTRKVMPKLPVL